MSAPRPYTLVAELTHRCPLACPHCSNPLALVPPRRELGAEAWERVFEEAEALGVVQLHLSGGEPLLRPDLERLVARARALDLYVNLVTSGVPLSMKRLEALVRAGVDHVQLSVQAASAPRGDAIAGLRVHERKLAALGWIRALGVELTLNCVLHRENLGEIDALVALAIEAGASKLELASAQYAGWALENRAALLPDEAALSEARARAATLAARHAERLEILFVKPDYFGARPKACMDGWARRSIVVAPDGAVLPCHAATSLPELTFERVGERPLGAIWRESAGLNAFRGEAWMRDPCRGCARREDDFGGCRCQAYALTGDATNTDPACSLSPHHAALAEARRSGGSRRFLHRGRA